MAATLASWQVCEIIFRDVSTHTRAQTDAHKQADTWLTAAVPLKKTAVSMEERLVC